MCDVSWLVEDLGEGRGTASCSFLDYWWVVDVECDADNYIGSIGAQVHCA